MNCTNCGRPSQAGERYCTHCGHELLPQKENAPQPVRRVNRVDEGMKDTFRSKTFKVFITFIFIFICVIPALCLCLGLLGIVPLSAYFNSLLQL